MKNIKKTYIAISIIILICNINCITSYCANENQVGDLYSLSAALIDGDTGRVLYEKKGFEKRPMASTTKIMTLILALEYGQDDDILTVSSYASKMPDVQLGIIEGEQYRLKDLFYSLMLESHNDVAVAIAEHIGGSVEGFQNMMNSKAKELGLNSTYFITPNGLDETDSGGTHSTTAIELARLMKYCVIDSPKKDEFIAICQTRNYSFTDYEQTRNFTVNNKNAYLDMREGVIAGKTGFTADAGYCYVVALENDGKTYIAALLGCGWPGNKSYKWKDSNKLLDYGINNFDIKSATDKNTKMKSIDIIDGTPYTTINTYIEEYDSFLIGNHEKISLKYNIPDKLQPPIIKGDIVGTINILIDKEQVKTVNVYAKESSFKKDIKYYMDLIIKTFF